MIALLYYSYLEKLSESELIKIDRWVARNC
jgi:hypothetical protein